MPKSSAGAILALAICSLPVYAQQGSVVLSVCNVGDVAIDVFVTKEGQVESAHNITARNCASVYQDIGSAEPAHLGFAFVDSSGKWGAAHRLDAFPSSLLTTFSFDPRNVSVRHGNQDVSLPMQLLFRPRDPICRVITSNQFPVPSYTRTCENLVASLNIMAYPDSNEITLLDKPQAPPRSRRVDWSNLKAYMDHLRDIRADKEQTIIDGHVVIRGTVSQVEVSLPGAVDPMVYVYFSESPERKVSAFSHRPDIFQEMFGPSFRVSMIGKALEVEGEMGRTGEIRITLSRQLHMSDKDLQATRGTPDRFAEEVRRLELEEARQRDLKKKAEDEAAKADLAAMQKSVADFDPEWVRKNLIVKGTVSRVELKPLYVPAYYTGPKPVWVILYFKESPDFVICFSDNGVNPANSAIRGIGGANFSGLIGKTVQAHMRVGHPQCAPNSVGMEVALSLNQMQVF